MSEGALSLAKSDNYNEGKTPKANRSQKQRRAILDEIKGTLNTFFCIPMHLEITLIKCEDDTKLRVFLNIKEENKSDMRIQKY